MKKNDVTTAPPVLASSEDSQIVRGALAKLVRTRRDRFSGKRHHVTTCVASRCSGTTFVATSHLKSRIKIDRSAIIHFTARLNFSNCPNLRGTIRRVVHHGLAVIRELSIAHDRVQSSRILDHITANSVRGVHHALRRLSATMFSGTIRLVTRTQRVCVFNTKDYGTLTDFFARCLRVLLNNGIRVVATTDRDRVFRRVLSMGSQSIIVNVDFPHCSTGTTGALRCTRAGKTNVVTVASDPLSPVTRRTGTLLATRDSVTSIISSLMTPVDIVGTLLITISLHAVRRAHPGLRRLRQL